MTAEIVNLRQARKTKARKQRQDRAAENRTLFGRTKAEKQRDTFEKSQHAKRIDGHLIQEPAEAADAPETTSETTDVNGGCGSDSEK